MESTSYVKSCFFLQLESNLSPGENKKDINKDTFLRHPEGNLCESEDEKYENSHVDTG